MSTNHETRESGRGTATAKTNKKPASGAPAVSLTKRGSITQTQANSAVRRYLSAAAKK